MNCELCRERLAKYDRRKAMTDLDEDSTKGQMVDYIAAELSGCFIITEARLVTVTPVSLI